MFDCSQYIDAFTETCACADTPVSEVASETMVVPQEPASRGDLARVSELLLSSSKRRGAEFFLFFYLELWDKREQTE